MANYFISPKQVLKDTVLHVEGVNSTSTMFYRGGFTFTSPGGAVFFRNISEAPPPKLPNGNWDLWWTANKDLGSPTSELGDWNCLFKSEKGDIQENFTYKVVDEIGPEPEPACKITQSDLAVFSDSHAKLTINGSLAVLNSPLVSGDSLVVTPDSGYQINSVSAYGISSEGLDVNISFTKNSNGSWAATFPDHEKLLTLDFNVESRVLPITAYTLINSDFRPSYKIQINDVDASAGDDVYVGDTLKIVIKDSVYYIKSAKMFGGDGKANFTVSDDGNSATWIVSKATNNVSWSGISVVTGEHSNPYSLQQKDLNAIAAGHVTMTVNGVAAAVGVNVALGTKLVLTANSGWTILNANVQNTIGQINNFNVSGDGTKATLTIDEFLDTTYTLNFNISSEQSTPEVRSSFNNIYLVTPETMAEINKKRFILGSSGGENPTIETKDYGQYILGLIDLPFAIDPSYILESESVILGNKQISVQTPKINSDIIRVDLGKIVVDGEFNNSLDYVGVTALLHLPRLSPINIGLEYVIGCEIGIKYYIDVYDGTATINISSSKVDDVIITQKVNMGFNVPYINEVSTGIENGSIRVGGDNGVIRPFIELVKTELILPTGFYTIPVIDEGNLTGKTGYIEVDNIKLNTTATAIERELIINTLKSGVIIND